MVGVVFWVAFIKEESVLYWHNILTSRSREKHKLKVSNVNATSAEFSFKMQNKKIKSELIFGNYKHLSNNLTQSISFP